MVLIIWLIVPFELTASIGPLRSLVKNWRAALTRVAKTAQLSGAIDLVALLAQRSSAQAAKMTFAVAHQIGGWLGFAIARI